MLASLTELIDHLRMGFFSPVFESRQPCDISLRAIQEHRLPVQVWKAIPAMNLC